MKQVITTIDDTLYQKMNVLIGTQVFSSKAHFLRCAIIRLIREESRKAEGGKYGETEYDFTS